jgi:hypothetical protein
VEYRSQLVLNNNITKNTRKQVSDALKDLLLEISAENKLKSSKKKTNRQGSSALVDPTQSSVTKSKKLNSSKVEKENLGRNVTPLAKSGQLAADLGIDVQIPTTVPVAAKKWKISPAKPAKRIATGRNMMVSIWSNLSVYRLTLHSY